MSQTLKVSSSWLRRAKLALSRHFSTQKAFATELGLSTRKVSDFFNGRPIDSDSFRRICQKLDLEWQKVAKVSAENLESLTPATDLKPTSTTTFATATAKTAPVEMSTEPQSGTSIPRLASHLFKTFNAPGSVDTLPRKKFVPASIVAELEPMDEEEVPEDVQLGKNDEEEVPEDIQLGKNEEPTQPIQLEDPIQHDEPIQYDEPIQPVQPKASLGKDTRKTVPAISQQTAISPQTATTPQEDATNRTLEALKAILTELESTEIKAAPTPLAIEALEIETLDRQADLIWDETETPLEELEEVDAGLLDRINDAISMRSADSAPDRLDDEVETLTLKVIPTEDSSHQQDIKPMLKLYRDACAIEDWDAASEIIKYTDWHYLKERGELQLILELHQQLLPNNWRSGGSRVSDPYRHWQILHNSGGASYYLGDYAAAVDYYEVALALAPQLDRPDLELSVLYGLGLTYQAVWQYQTAIKYFQQFLMRAGEQEDWPAQKAALCSLGNIYYALRQYRTAIGYYQKFLSTTSEGDRQAREINILSNLGSAYFKLGDYQAAIGYQQRYLEITRAAGNYEKEASALVSLGFAYSAIGLEQTAIEHHQQALNLARQLRNEHLQMSALKGLGHSYRDLNNHRMAISCYQQWLEIAKKRGDRDEQVQAMYSLRKLHGSLARAN
jgi:tetratricopeptide (TPR) repeat protein